jgi:hypothetical protein
VALTCAKLNSFLYYNSNQCFCNEQFDTKACSVQGIYKTADVVEHDPRSLKCAIGSVNVMSEYILRTRCCWLTKHGS